MDVKKYDTRMLTGFISLRIVAGCCEHGNRISERIKCSEFLDQLLKKDSAAWS
jgi:hypothetical protein